MSDPLYKDRPLSSSNTARQTLLLVRIAEEAAEVIQAATKALRFGADNFHPDDATKETNIHALWREADDLNCAVLDFVEESRRVAMGGEG